MLIRHNGGGLRLAALGALGFVFLACSNPTGAETSPSTRASPAAVASSRAADLRTQLDLLLAEHVMIVAKESAAAVNRSDEYSSYTALLTTNSTDLTSLMSRAFGNTAATQLAQAWSVQNGYLVDYAIGVVTHNDDKANGAMSGLMNGFVLQFAQVISSVSGLPLDSVTQPTAQQMLGDKAFIDDVFAQKYASFYVDLHKAYAQASRLGDVLAAQIVQSFPDKFPGDPTAHAVDVRVAFNVWLQEHAYLATIATDAVVAGRNSEKTAAASALAANADLLGTAFANAFGSAAATQFNTIWAARDKALLGYASGDVQSKQALTETFVTAFVSFGRVDKAHARNQVMATIRVIDDQRAKSKSVAGDDRAAATAMQPIADSIQS